MRVLLFVNTTIPISEVIFSLQIMHSFAVYWISVFWSFSGTFVVSFNSGSFRFAGSDSIERKKRNIISLIVMRFEPFFEAKQQIK